MLRVLMKLPLLSFTAMEEDDLEGRTNVCENVIISPSHYDVMIWCQCVFEALRTHTSTWVLLMRYSSG